MITFEAREVTFRGKPRIEGSYFITTGVMAAASVVPSLIEERVGQRITAMYPAAVKIMPVVNALKLQVLVNPRDTEAFLEVDCILKSLGLPV